MNLLLDTHVLLWWYDGGPRLGNATRRVLDGSQARIWISAVSVWEISIKLSIGRLNLKGTAEQRIADLLQRGCHSLDITFDHAFAVRHLPLLHGDPFDRMLVAQAQCEGLTLVTVDPKISAYNVPTLDASA